MARQELETVVISDRVTGRVEITGYVIGRVDTRDGAPGQGLAGPRPRWGVNQVIKLRDSTYVLVREAFSVVYHRPDTTCRTRTHVQSGEPATVADLPDDAQPCWVCRPRDPEDLGDAEPVRYEFPRRTIDQCADPGQVVARLTSSRKHSGTRTIEVPEPVKALLAQCQDNDPDFVMGGAPAVRIG